MTDAVINHRALKFIEAVKVAYVDGGKSYNGVAVELGTNSHKIRHIMERHWPASIRPQKLRKKGPRPDEQMSLRSLGQFNVGDCTECRVPLVSKIEHIAGSQICGFCLPGAARPR